jgi:hypothetical protein
MKVWGRGIKRKKKKIGQQGQNAKIIMQIMKLE